MIIKMLRKNGFKISVTKVEDQFFKFGVREKRRNRNFSKILGGTKVLNTVLICHDSYIGTFKNILINETNFDMHVSLSP